MRDPAMSPDPSPDPFGRSDDSLHPGSTLAGGIIRQALEAIIGPPEASRFAGIQDLAGLARELENYYGEQAGHGIALRIGGACFEQMARRIGDQSELAQPAFRLLPLPLRLRRGLIASQDLLSDFVGKGAQVDEQDGGLLLRLRNCPICSGRVASDPICHLMLGLLKEALGWMSGGRFFDVQEITCRGRSDEVCLFAIDPVPVEL